MRRMAFQQNLQLAIEHHRAGRLQQAHDLYRQLLSHEPNNADVLHLMGVLAHQSGRNDVAIDLIGRAIAQSGNVAVMHYNLAEALRATGRRDDAVAALRRTVELEPNHAAAHANLSLLMNDLGRFDDAIVEARRAIELDPAAPLPHVNLANALAHLGRTDEAMQAAQQAIRMNPNLPAAHNTLGICYGRQNRLDDAIASFREAVRLQPNFAEALGNLGVMLAKSGKPSEAIAPMRQAALLRPDHVPSHDNLATVLKEAGQHAEAAWCYEKIATLLPNSADAQFNMAVELEQLWQLDAAVAALKRTLALDPNHIGATGLLGIVRMKQGMHDESLSLMRASLNAAKNAKLHTNLCLLANYHPTLTSDEVLAIHREWERDYAPPTRQSIDFPNDRSPDRKLRIGYVSPDFKAHASGHFIDPILTSHDRAHFHVIAYSNVAKPDDATAMMKSKSDEWRDVFGHSDEELEAMIRADRIDILVDLAGHTADTRLAVFARRPAPVQVSMVGYPSTTGLGTIDYKISDPVVDPPGAERFYSEKLLRLHGTFWCFTAAIDSPPVDELPARRNGFITFGAVNNVSKISPAALDAWARIVAAVPGSRVRMQHSAFSSVEVRRHVTDAFARHGVGQDRITMTGWARFVDYLEMLRGFDLALDTFPFNGGTTTCQLMYAGIPCVALAGERQVSRMGVTMLRAVGLDDLVADTVEQLVQKSIDLAKDHDRLAAIRAMLRPAMLASPLGDGKKYTAALEAAYRQAWIRWCEQA